MKYRIRSSLLPLRWLNALNQFVLNVSNCHFILLTYYHHHIISLYVTFCAVYVMNVTGESWSIHFMAKCCHALCIVFRL